MPGPSATSPVSSSIGRVSPTTQNSQPTDGARPRRLVRSGRMAAIRPVRVRRTVSDVEGSSYRASDAEREQAVVALRSHLLAGRLTLDEFSDRVELALRATSGRDLAQLQ